MPPPPALRRYLSFARLTPRSLDMVARAVDRDAEFRARVAAEVSEDDVGRAGWLWLDRPEGWEEELAEIESARAAQQVERSDAREERVATRKLAMTREALARADADVDRQGAELAALRAELAREQEARAAAERRVADLEDRAVEAAGARAEVVRNLKATEERLVARATELKAAKVRLRELEQRLDRPAEPADPPVPPAAVATGWSSPPGPDPSVPSGPAVPPGGAGVPSTPTPPGSAPGAPLDADHLAADMARAAEGATALADALAGLARALGQGRAGTPAPAPTAGADEARDRNGERPRRATPGTGGSASSPGRAPCPPAGTDPAAAGPPGDDAAGAGGLRAVPVRRVPVALPGGVFDDTAEAAEHLLRTPGAVLVVDGYNVTMQGWPELAVADQRRRIVTALSDLAQRTATRVELVFDGAEVEPSSVPAPGRRLVRVRFSDPGVEADDVVIDLVAGIPAATPVIVASSDRRVRDGARRRGANLIHAHQLVALLRR